MTEIHSKPHYDTERRELQDYLATIDRDKDKLQHFIADLYRNHEDNPHMLYTAATHLTALTYLDRRDASWQPILPSREDAGRAFSTYTRLIDMLNQERDAPLYADNKRVRSRLKGALEELAFHATLTYATAQGADFVALPAPSELDFSGVSKATDVHVFFEDPDENALDIQVTVHFPSKIKKRKDPYHPDLPVLSLSQVLGDDKAIELRGILKETGMLDDTLEGQIALPAREHEILLASSASILLAARNWNQA